MANGNKAHKLMGAGAATLIAEPALAMAHQGGLGIIVGLVIGAVAYGIVDEVEQRTGGQLVPVRNQPLATEKAARGSDGKSKPNFAHRLLVGKSVREAESERATDDPDGETIVITDPDSEEEQEEDAAFAHQEAETDTADVPRLTIEQIVRNTQRNSYEVFIGRSLTKPRNPAIKINFYKRHLKLIGASQHGKTSEAAAILEAILRTHDTKHVQVSILDLENKIGRLFADAPHVLKLRIDGEVVRFHARSYEEVLQHLRYLSSVIDHRYTLSEEELDRLPLLIVYMEEFIDLKDYFKHRASAAPAGPERDQAKQDYARLIYCIKKIAARGLKVLVQLLMCAQVNYRDEDLQAALVNVTSGMSFCVLPSAALAAGFYQNELLQRNAREDKFGQAVAEMPDCKDLVLAPEYDWKARLAALAPATQREPLAFLGMRAETERIAATGTDVPALTMPALAPRPQPARRVVTVQDAYNAWQEGATGPRKLERVLGIPYNQARDLFTEMQRQGLIPQENE